MLFFPSAYIDRKSGLPPTNPPMKQQVQVVVDRAVVWLARGHLFAGCGVSGNGDLAPVGGENKNWYWVRAELVEWRMSTRKRSRGNSQVHALLDCLA